MGRAPCCDKVGLKRGPWTPEEDQVLVSFIHQHGHSNWRALPKQAGLLRCGKSCRLRWINYLRPDIKRGNFTKEEEDTIIQLHEMMGNRWSAIAARLPGRTDNEIKNVWHTHLKKRLDKKYHHHHQKTKSSQGKVVIRKHTESVNNNVATSNSTISTNSFPETSVETTNHPQNSSQRSYSSDDFSSLTDVSSGEIPNNTMSSASASQRADEQENGGLDEYFSIIDETFWTSQDDINMDYTVLSDIIEDEQVQQFDQSSSRNNGSFMYIESNSQVNEADSMDFWLDVFVRAGGAPELPEF